MTLRLRVLNVFWFLVLAACARAQAPVPTAEQTQQWLDANIRLGATASEVAKFLRNHELQGYKIHGDLSIEHDSRYIYLTHTPLPASGYIAGWIEYPRREERFFGIYCTTSIIIAIDEHNRVISRKAEKASCTGP